MRKKITWQALPGLHIIFACVLMLQSSFMFADGSKDLYPSGKNGHRALLRSSTTVQEYYPFPNLGTHYVYAKAGEKLALASSAQGLGSARIRLYSTTGALLLDNSSTGKINNRTQELAGPKLSASDATANRYTPLYHNVTTSGIYRVEFISPNTGGSNHSAVILANSNWTQSNNRGIAAWEVGVINTAGTEFVKGRVYTNVFNFSMGNDDTSTSVGFYGVVYALTKDGYTYRVDNNGSNGIWFTYFVNNNGFINNSEAPIYKSLNTSAPGAQVRNPNSADTSKSITHKMFYTLPATDLPTSSAGAVPGGNTWLKNAVVTPQVSNLTLVGAEGVPGHVSNKGGYVQFNSGAQGQYTIVIQSSSTPAQFVTRTLTGITSAGANSIYWDGKDGAGNDLPHGVFPATIKVQLNGAEVHFPFIDMEYNTKGIKLELLNHTNLTGPVVSDIVYWNDTDIPNVSNGTNSSPKNNTHLPPVNSTGISSNVNGHKWGVGGTGSSGQFGDQKSIDTWTFITGEATTFSFDIDHRVADLKISHLSSDKHNLLPGDQLVYTVKAANDGPGDASNAPFSFKIPQGFNHQSVAFSGNSCGAQSTAVTHNPATNTYSSAVNLPYGCEITYTFTVGVNNPPAMGVLQADATIMRTNDFTDPDATNPDPNVPPTDPYYECANNGLSVPCNNIRAHKVFYSETEICTEDVEGEAFSTSNGTSVTFNQPATDYGFQFDIYTLDNSFNMTINGVQLATMEIDFQYNHNTSKSIRFADGSQYGDGTVPEIYDMTGTAGAPLVRVIISPSGHVSMYGSKSSGGALEPLELFNGNTFNVINWNTSSANTVVATQQVDGDTYITGYGSGLKIVPCECYNPAYTPGNGPDSKVGITLLRRAGAQNSDNWPMARKSAHLVMESNAKGFVITRIAKTDLGNIANPQEGMMVYDTTDKCLKIYSDGAWKCFSTAACP